MSSKPRCHDCRHPRGYRASQAAKTEKHGNKTNRSNEKRPCACFCHLPGPHLAPDHSDRRRRAMIQCAIHGNTTALCSCAQLRCPLCGRPDHGTRMCDVRLTYTDTAGIHQGPPTELGGLPLRIAGQTTITDEDEL